MNAHTPFQEQVIKADHAELMGFLLIPANAAGIVVFAHGSGSSRFSERNNAVAAYLRDAQLGTLLFDLLTNDEERIDVLTREYRFDIPLLCERLAAAVRWLTEQPDAAGLPIGLFGSSTGAAAALIVAAGMPDLVAAVVSRGGRVDLASDYLAKVRSPTLLIVGGADTDVLRLNRAAQQELHSVSKIAVIDRATHLFEEPGALEEVEELARAWFVEHFRTEPIDSDT